MHIIWREKRSAHIVRYHHTTTFDGDPAPLTKPIGRVQRDQATWSGRAVVNNEYVVFQPWQVWPRYIVQYTFDDARGAPYLH